MQCVRDLVDARRLSNKSKMDLFKERGYSHAMPKGPQLASFARRRASYLPLKETHATAYRSNISQLRANAKFSHCNGGGIASALAPNTARSSLHWDSYAKAHLARHPNSLNEIANKENLAPLKHTSVQVQATLGNKFYQALDRLDQSLDEFYRLAHSQS